MPRSTTKALASQAASAARKVIGRGAGPKAEPEGETPQAKGATEKSATKAAKAAEKPAAAKKAAGETPVKKTSATRATKKTAPTKAKQTTANKTRATPTVTERSRDVTAKKAAPTKNAALSELVVKADEAAWTKEELAEVLEELHEQKAHCLEVLGAQELELNGLMRDAGDGAGLDQADVGATTFERDHELTVLISERTKLAQIERALVRIDDGSYGICESCGEPIGKMRLMAFPRATLCMTCKQREERR